MHKPVGRMSVTLKWLALTWLVGWALYVTLWDEFAPTTREMMLEVAELLIPAILAFAASWALDRYAAPNPSGNRAGLTDHA